MKNKIIFIILSALLVLTATLFYLRNHNYTVSIEEYSGADKASGFLPLEEVIIEAECDGRSLNLITQNHSEYEISMYSEFPVTGLYLQKNGGWHAVLNKGYTNGGKGMVRIIHQNTEQSIVINCRDKFGGHLPKGEYIVRVFYQTTEGRKCEQIVRFSIK